jgi:hypothetical protein
VSFEYLIVRNFLNKADCSALSQRLDDFQSKGIVLDPDMLCPNSPAFYGIFNDEALEWLPTIEKLVDKQLHPTYTYSRIYTQDEVLFAHKDRAACEYSITLTLKYDEKIWPFWIETSSGNIEVLLDVGDILIYNGVNNKHWRDALEGKFHYQAFLHFVDKDGPLAEYRFDGKPKFQSTQEAADVTLRKKNVTHRSNY